jgi:TPR repeat protein
MAFVLAVSVIAVAEEALTNADVVAMVKAGLSVETIQQKVDGATAAFDISAEALRSLRDAGVPDAIVSKMLLGGAATQDDLGLGGDALQDVREATAWWRKAAEQGHAKAQYRLGLAYASGEGIPKDLAEAAIWYRKAADQGHLNAQYALAWAYSTGEGVPKDPSQAAVWYRCAAEKGLARAQYRLGLAYANGEGVPKDPAQAARWFQEAADQGDPDAQYSLGIAYSRGEGVVKDEAQAALWFGKAATIGKTLSPP